LQGARFTGPERRRVDRDRLAAGDGADRVDRAPVRRDLLVLLLRWRTQRSMWGLVMPMPGLGGDGGRRLLLRGLLLLSPGRRVQVGGVDRRERCQDGARES